MELGARVRNPRSDIHFPPLDAWVALLLVFFGGFMKRPAFSVGLATVLFVGLSASLFDLGCYVHGSGDFCAARSHPGHVDEYGEPDPCCLSAVPCCANPLWGRKAMKDGYEWGDPCCLVVPCPFWDVDKGADAGPDGEATETDTGTSPEAGSEGDAGAGGRS